LLIFIMIQYLVLAGIFVKWLRWIYLSEYKNINTFTQLFLCYAVWFWKEFFSEVVLLAMIGLNMFHREEPPHD
jgi:hypothetical protein